MKKEARESSIIREMIEKADKNREYDDSETYFNIINDYLNSVSKYSKFIFNDNEEEYTKSLRVFDDYYRDDPKEPESLLRKFKKFHLIEWTNYDANDESIDLASIKITSHFMAKRGGGIGEHSVVVHMHARYAKQLFEHAEKIACLKSVLKK